MSKLIKGIMLAGMLLVVGCGSNGGGESPTFPNVAGDWTMTANTIYTFDLTLTQSGETISGQMDATNTVDLRIRL
jgi:hypothetical protein